MKQIDLIYNFLHFFLSFYINKTLARLCVEKGLIDSLDILLKHGSKPKNLIRSAVRKKQMKSLEYLIKNGFNVDETTHGVPNPLITAVMDNSLDIVKVLLENGADPSAVGEQTPVSIACQQKNHEILSLLLEHDAPPSPLISKAIPPLLILIKNHDIQNLCELVRKGVNPNTFQESRLKKKKLYALEYAVKEKDCLAIILLLFAGCNTKYANYSKDKLDSDSLEILDDLNKIKNNPVEKEKFPLCNEIESLEKDKEKIKKELSKLNEQLLPTQDITELKFAPSITAARKGYKLFIQYVQKLIDFTTQLQEMREPLLSEQVSFFQEYIAHRNIRTCDFMQFIPKENHTREQILQNMEELYQLTYTVDRFNILLVHTYHMIEAFHKETKSYVDFAFIEIGAAEEKITKLSKSSALLVRAGLPQTQIDSYQKTAPSRIDQLRQTRGQLDTLWEQCSQLETELLKSIRQCYK